jgi:hypothetical protein
LRYGGKELWNEREYEIVEWTYRPRYAGPELDSFTSKRYYIGPDTLVYRIRTLSTRGEVEDEQLSKLELGRALSAAELTLALGPTVRVKPYRPTRAAGIGEGGYGVPMNSLVGKAAPAFTIETANGSQLSLADLTRQGRAVVIFNWFYG